MTRTPSPDEARQAALNAGTGEPESGAKRLDETHETLTTYVVFPSPEAADATALFAAATHAAAHLEFAARLVIRSPVKRCGKSRLVR